MCTVHSCTAGFFKFVMFALKSKCLSNINLQQQYFQYDVETKIDFFFFSFCFVSIFHFNFCRIFKSNKIIEMKQHQTWTLKFVEWTIKVYVVSWKWWKYLYLNLLFFLQKRWSYKEAGLKNIGQKGHLRALKSLKPSTNSPPSLFSFYST